MDLHRLQQLHAALLSGKLRAARALPEPWGEGRSQVTPRLLFPGAFNPLHAGHKAMADWAAERLQVPLEFEISLVNVDKPPLTIHDLTRRLEQFPPHQPVWLTHASRFAEKAQLFPGATFVVGFDTITRLTDARYYDGDETRQQRAIEHIAAQGCRFLVFGRAMPSGFQTLSQIALPPTLAAICQEVTEAEFRHDQSSTQLRIALSESRKLEDAENEGE
jgi:hypothetical protein